MRLHETDVLVVGAGMGGMCAALFASQRGLRVLLCEKTEQVGGTTATSAGSVWLPGALSSDLAELKAAEIYLDAEIGNRGSRKLREVFLSSCKEALSALQENTDVRFRPVRPHPDYHPASPGWSMAGHALAPIPFDGRLLGSDFSLVRPPMNPFMVLGGLMIGRDDIEHFLHPFRSMKSLRLVARKVIRHAADRARYPRGTQLIMGNALVARLLFSIRKRDIPLWTRCRLIELLRDGNRVQGAVVEINGEVAKVIAPHGVVLATGGFSHSQELRDRFLPAAAKESVAFTGNSGDGIFSAQAVGAAIADVEGHAAFWMPASVMRKGDGRVVFPHIILDRAKPGLIAVNEHGNRFTNEADSYHDFVVAMLQSEGNATWLVCDARFIRHYGLGLVHPGSSDGALKKFVDAGYLRCGRTLEELAEMIKVNSENLMQSVGAHNRYAQSGVDEAFGKGSNALNRHNGDPTNAPNPCLRALTMPPFYAVAVYAADLGTSTGLATNEHAQVLDGGGAPICGLYACGNDMSSVMAGAYPGPGTTLGPALVFAYRAITHIAA